MNEIGFYHSVNIVNGVTDENGERSHFAAVFENDKTVKNRVSSTFDDFVFQSWQRLWHKLITNVLNFSPTSKTKQNKTKRARTADGFPLNGIC